MSTAKPAANLNVRRGLVLVGRDEDAQDRIAAAVQEAGLEQEVVMFGEASDDELARWYSQADLFVLFSHYEAFGLVFFEAMAHGDARPDPRRRRQPRTPDTRRSGNAPLQPRPSGLSHGPPGQRRRPPPRARLPSPSLHPGQFYVARSGGEVLGGVSGSVLLVSWETLYSVPIRGGVRERCCPDA